MKIKKLLKKKKNSQKEKSESSDGEDGHKQTEPVVEGKQQIATAPRPPSQQQPTLQTISRKSVSRPPSRLRQSETFQSASSEDSDRNLGEMLQEISISNVNTKKDRRKSDTSSIASYATTATSNETSATSSKASHTASSPSQSASSDSQTDSATTATSSGISEAGKVTTNQESNPVNGSQEWQSGDTSRRQRRRRKKSQLSSVTSESSNDQGRVNPEPPSKSTNRNNQRQIKSANSDTTSENSLSGNRRNSETGSVSTNTSKSETNTRSSGSSTATSSRQSSDNSKSGVRTITTVVSTSAGLSASTDASMTTASEEKSNSPGPLSSPSTTGTTETTESLLGQKTRGGKQLPGSRRNNSRPVTANSRGGKIEDQSPTTSKLHNRIATWQQNVDVSATLPSSQSSSPEDTPLANLIKQPLQPLQSAGTNEDEDEPLIDILNPQNNMLQQLQPNAAAFIPMQQQQPQYVPHQGMVMPTMMYPPQFPMQQTGGSMPYYYPNQMMQMMPPQLVYPQQYPTMPHENTLPHHPQQEHVSPRSEGDDLTPFDSVSNPPDVRMNPGIMPQQQFHNPIMPAGGLHLQPNPYQQQHHQQPVFYNSHQQQHTTNQSRGNKSGRKSNPQPPEWVTEHQPVIGGEGTLMEQVKRGRDNGPKSGSNLVSQIQYDPRRGHVPTLKKPAKNANSSFQLQQQQQQQAYLQHQQNQQQMYPVQYAPQMQIHQQGYNNPQMMMMYQQQQQPPMQNSTKQQQQPHGNGGGGPYYNQ